MGLSLAPPINEAVNLLSRLAPGELASLAKEFPSIAEELQPGRIGGEATDSQRLDYERAEVAARALIAVSNRASIEMVDIQRRMRTARSRRLGSQVATLICSSGVLAAFALSQNLTAVVISVLTLLASVGTLAADYGEKLLKPGEGDIYQAFEQASNSAFRARNVAGELRLMVRHRGSRDELQALIASSNKLAEELNGWVTKMAGSR